MYQTFSLRLQFHTPAFLGNASQQGQWRSPPVKALLRQWWRTAVAQQLGYSVERLRQQENRLFGTAADGEGDSRQSLIRLRLGQWSHGKQNSWHGLEQGSIYQPEAEKSKFKVGPHAYLGYGPLDGRKGTEFSKKNGSAIQAQESSTLKLAVPAKHADDIATALWLMDRYGTLGGRSRNGWGSLSLQHTDTGSTALPQPARLPLVPWRDALRRDWPHAIGSDEQGALVWQTAAFTDWQRLMQELARLKIALRTQRSFTFHTGKDAPAPEARHWLSYPVTNHSVKSWGGNARLPNSLRFKVRPAPGKPGQLVGVVFHVPCQPPPAFQPDLRSIEQVWRTVHAFLDQPEQRLTRTPA